VLAIEPDSGQSLTYAITGGNTNGVFAINSATGQLTVAKATIDYETLKQYNLMVQVTDNGTPTPQSNSATVTVNIANLNEPPTFLLPTSFTISENRSVGYVVGTVKAVDPEKNAIAYSITGGDPNAQFAINATTGQITVAKATIDYETRRQFVLQVKAQDNGSPANSRTQNVTVNIANINEAPAFLTPTTFSLAELAPNGTVVGTVRTVDPEGNSVSYSLTGGNLSNAFAINAATGQITVNNSAALNASSTPQFLLSIKATDNGSPSNSRTQTITVNLVRVNQPPAFTGTTTFTIPENRANGTTVGTVTAVDPEATAVTYAITAGNTNGAFVINSSTGVITVANRAALDYETTPQFLLTVKATDSGNPPASRTQTITINLTDIRRARVAASSTIPLPLTADNIGPALPMPTHISAAPTLLPFKKTKETPGLYSFLLFERIPELSNREDRSLLERL
jgi:hypothetical protein